MPDLLVALMLWLAVIIGWIGVIQLSRSVRQTSLTAAAAWALWFQGTLTIVAIATLAESRLQPGLIDQLRYFTAVSALCPFVAVLGARRGRLLDWSLFVIVPLILVLEWPALAQWTRCWNGQRLEFETPTQVGYTVVLLMAVGNFVPTRFVWASVSWMAAWAWELFQLSNEGTVKSLSQSLTALLTLVFWANLHGGVRQPPLGTWNQVWFDFRDWFGLAWAARVSARINEVAEREQWPWRLTSNGLQSITPNAAAPADPADDPRVQQTFRWLLKPFVDSEWIDERLRVPNR